jgi:predicted DNA-binding protein
MSTTTIYARVPEDLKERVDAYADATGKTIAAAVTELLEQGLRGMREQISLEQRVSVLESKVNAL